MKTRPSVSIGMPVYNEEAFIRPALEGILAQSYGDFELIISDNASVDRTREICLEYVSRDPRVRYCRAEHNLGSIANFNQGFQLTDTEYFLWASGHDLRHPLFLERCMDVIRADDSIVLCYPLARWLDSDGSPGAVIPANADTRGLDQLAGMNTILWGLYYAYPIYGLLRSGALKETGLMGKTIGGDITLLVELSLIGKLAQVPEPLLYIRRLPDYGDWRKYLSKSLGAYSKHPAHLYYDWVLDLVRAVSKREIRYMRRTLFIFSIVFCMFTKYRMVLRGLLKRR